jgi:hypothetical protein
MYETGDILDYEYHAYLRFEHPALDTGGVQFLNVRVTNAFDGLADWLVKNLPMSPGQETRPIHYRMNMESISSGEGAPEVILLEPVLGEFSLTGDFIADSLLELVAVPVSHMVPNGRRSSHFPPAIPYFGPFLPPIILPDTIRYLNRGCVVPNIDLDSMAHKDSNPDDTVDDGDLNACGPAAAANSLKWLMETSDEIPDTLALRAILDSLKHFAKKSGDSIIITPDPDDPSMMDTMIKPGGVFWYDLVAAKLQLIDRYRLPIRVKYQSHTPNPNAWPEIHSPDSTYGSKAKNQTGPTGIPDFDWLCDELDHGEDVELDINYWCRDEEGDSMRFETGHVVNLIGYAKFGNQMKVMWKHDIDQRGPGGTVEEWGCWELAKKPNDNSPSAPLYPVITEISDPGLEGCVAYVGSVISESYDSTVTFCPKRISKADDSGQNTLREAVDCAKGGDTITLSPALGGDTICLTSEPIKIDSNITICADPDDMIHIKAQDIDRAFEISDGATVELKGFAVIGGTDDQGSAIKVEGSLILYDMILFPGTSDEGEKVILNEGDVDIRGFTNVKDD